MPFVTFIYKINSSDKTYNGKWNFDYMSDDHDGLDILVIEQLKHAYKLQNLSFIVAIIGFSLESAYDYSSEKEITLFDFYCNNEKAYYIGGNKV